MHKPVKVQKPLQLLQLLKPLKQALKHPLKLLRHHHQLLKLLQSPSWLCAVTTVQGKNAPSCLHMVVVNVMANLALRVLWVQWAVRPAANLATKKVVGVIEKTSHLADHVWVMRLSVPNGSQ
jgi:hypothetical protein